MNRVDTMQAHAKTDIGLRRENNEDNFLIVDPEKGDYDTDRFGVMFVIADGMGGHAAGEVASRMACENMLRYYAESEENCAFSEPESRFNHLEDVIHRTNNRIYRYSRDHKGCRGMGTTLSTLVLTEDTALIGHVGDSRIYRQRGDLLEQLTVDQTEAQSMVEMGYLTPEQAAGHPFRHVLLQAVGVAGGLEKIDTRIEEIKTEDIFMLSSDGLHDMVTDKEIQAILSANPDPQGACGQLVERALEKGGSDNVTVIVIRV